MATAFIVCWFALVALASSVSAAPSTNFFAAKDRTYYGAGSRGPSLPSSADHGRTLQKMIARMEADPLPPLSASPTAELLQLSFMHRHGARTEPIISDHGLSWAHCILSPEGAQMAESLGRWLKARYTGFFPEKMNQEEFVTRSTQFERTILTAMGVLRGIYNETYDVPYIHHQDRSTDLDLGYYYSWPTADLRKPWFDGYAARQDGETMKFMTQKELDEVGAILGVPHICATEQTTCALLALDVALCSHSNSPDPNPTLEALLPKLFIAQEQSLDFLYMYNDQDRYWLNAGPYALLIALDIVDKFKTALKWKTAGAAAGARPPKVYHFSAHDVTIYGLFVALGVINQTTTDREMLVPSFTAAVLLELSDDGTVTLVYGRCEQAYQSRYAYHIVEPERAQLMCDAPDGTVYYGSSCPLDALERALLRIAKRSPTAVPHCYADPRDVTDALCAPAEGLSQTTIESLEADIPYAQSAVGQSQIYAAQQCIAYRSKCLEEACSPALVQSNTSSTAGEYVLNRSTMGCVPMHNVTTLAADTGDIVGRVAVVVACFLLGVLLGVFVFMCIDQWRRTHRGDGEEAAEVVKSAE